MIKKWLVIIGLWLAQKGGWEAHKDCVIPHFTQSPTIIEDAKMFINQVDKGFPETSGEFKRREVYRALMNRFPGEKHRILALAIELAFADHE